MPLVGQVANPLLPPDTPRAGPDTGSVGYYKTSLASGIAVEMAASTHAGVYQYTFNPNNYNRSSTSSILIDVSHVLLSYRGLGTSQSYAGGSVQIFPDGHYETSGIYNGGWNYGTIHDLN